MNEDMQALSREMTKAGLIEEMMAEGMDEALGGGDEVEEEAGLEINAILAELVPDLPDAPWNAVKPVSRGSRVKEHGRRHVSIDPGGRVSLSLSLSLLCAPRRRWLPRPWLPLRPLPRSTRTTWLSLRCRRAPRHSSRPGTLTGRGTCRGTCGG